MPEYETGTCDYLIHTTLLLVAERYPQNQRKDATDPSLVRAAKTLIAMVLAPLWATMLLLTISPVSAYAGVLPNPSLGPAPDIKPLNGAPPVPESIWRCGQDGLYPVTNNGADPRGTSPGSPNPLAGVRFFVDPTEPAFAAYANAYRAGDFEKARLLAKIAYVPRSRWFGRWTGSGDKLYKMVRGYLACVATLQPGTVPIMVVMRHIGQECHPRYTAGGHAEDVRTMRWYDVFARAIGNARVVIGFEPDSIGTIKCLAPSRRKDRIKVLRYGLKRLSQLPNATIYVEAEASDWEDAEVVATRLRMIGIEKARGVMLNATHYDWTMSNILFCWRLSPMIGNKPCIINTGSNGRGPLHIPIRRGKRVVRKNVWCNPPGRGLGIPTRAVTNIPLVDGFVWIDRPGLSDGTCNGGPPVAKWWEKRALELARRASMRLGPGD